MSFLPSFSDRRPHPAAFVFFWIAASVSLSLAWSFIPLRWSVWSSALFTVLPASGQTLVLAPIVSWYGWWVPASFASGVMNGVLSQWFFRLPGSKGIPGQMLFLAICALPQTALLFRQYGTRSLAWLALAPLVMWNHTVVSYIMVGPGRFVNHSIPASWIPPAAVTGTLSMLMQGAVIAWIMAEEFRQKPASAPVIIRRPSARKSESTEPGSTEPGARHSGATQPESKKPEAAAPGVNPIPVFLSLIVLLAVAFFGFMPNNPRMTAGARTEVSMIVLAALSPWAIALILLFRRQTRHLGLTLAAASSLIVLVPFIASAALTFGGAAVLLMFWLGPLGVVGTPVALLATAILTTRAAFKTPASERVIWAWPVSVILPLAIGYAIFTIVTLPQARRDRVEQAQQAKETIERATLLQLKTCAADYAKKHPERGYPASLQDLGPCIDRALATGTAAGMQYEYLPLLPDASGVVRGYLACQQPAKPLDTGWGTLIMDESSLIDRFGQSVTGVTPSSILSCDQAWRRSWQIKAVRYCAARFAAAHPDRGYPATMAEIGPAGDKCLDTKPEKEYGQHSIREMAKWTTYIAGPRDAAGRVTSYESYEVRPYAGGFSQSLVDVVGKMRRATGSRLATVYDPGVDESTTRAAPAPRMPAASESPTVETLPLFDQACTNHVGTACLALARMFSDVAGTAPRVDHYLNLGCDAGDPDACRLLGERLAATDPARATRLLVKSCAASNNREQCGQYW